MVPDRAEKAGFSSRILLDFSTLEYYRAAFFRNVTNDTGQFPISPESSEIQLLEPQKSQSALYFNKIMGISWGLGKLCLTFFLGGGET